MIIKYLAPILLTSPILASPINISGVIIDSNANFISGTIYVDSTISNSRGIGTIHEIRDKNGDVLWIPNGEELNFTFEGYNHVRNVRIDSFTSKYGHTDGRVDFYINSSGIFNPSGSYINDSASIASGTFHTLACS